jgi:hypothetical protein
MKAYILISVALGGTAALAGVDRKIRITDDRQLYKRLSETRVQPAQELAFDSDIAKLEALEPKYNERLSAHPRLKNSIQRITHMKYRPTKR